MKSTLDRDSVVQIAEEPSNRVFQSLRLRYQVLQLTVSNFLQRIQIRRRNPAVPSVSSTSSQVVDYSTQPSIRGKSKPGGNVSRRHPKHEFPIYLPSPEDLLIQPSQSQASASTDLNNNECSSDQRSTSTEGRPRRKARARGRRIKTLQVPSEGEVIATPNQASSNQTTESNPPVLKLRLRTPQPRLDDTHSSSHRIRQRRSSRTIQHDRKHYSDPNIKPTMGDSGTRRHLGNEWSSKKSEGEITFVDTQSSVGSEFETDMDESMETLSLHPPSSTVEEEENDIVDRNSFQPQRDFEYLAVYRPEPEKVVESISNLDETDLGRIPILKLRKKSVNFHRTALQRISSSITSIPSTTKNFFRIRRRPQPGVTTFMRSTVEPEEKEPSNIIFSMIDLKKHREERGKHNVAVGLGIIFRNESIRENSKKKKSASSSEASDTDEESVYGDEILDENLFSEDHFNQNFQQDQLMPDGEFTDSSSFFFGQRSLTGGRSQTRESFQPASRVESEESEEDTKLRETTKTDVNRILARYTQPQLDPLLAHPLSPYYARPVFQGYENVGGYSMEAKVKAEQEQAAALRNYYPRTSFTAQFAHLLPTARRKDLF